MRIPAKLVVGIVITLIFLVLYLSLTATGAIPGLGSPSPSFLVYRGLLVISLLIFLLLVSLWSRLGRKKDEEL